MSVKPSGGPSYFSVRKCPCGVKMERQDDDRRGFIWRCLVCGKTQR